MDGFSDNVEECAHFISKNLTPRADLAVVLGSGLGGAVSHLETVAEMKYEEIAHFPVSKIKGHRGKLIVSQVGEKIVLVLQGRFHYYEGYTMRGVAFPIRVLHRLGVGSVMITNAAGGLNRRFKPGDFMLITDHLNMMGANPLIGVEDERSGAPFVDLRGAYDPGLIKTGQSLARRFSIAMHQGVLAAVSGPSYETEAEAKFLTHAGGDAVTMSTVPEVITARHCGMKVLGLSCITNSLWQRGSLEHADVVDVGAAAAKSLAPWVREMLKEM